VPPAPGCAAAAVSAVAGCFGASSPADHIGQAAEQAHVTSVYSLRPVVTHVQFSSVGALANPCTPSPNPHPPYFRSTPNLRLNPNPCLTITWPIPHLCRCSRAPLEPPAAPWTSQLHPTLIKPRTPNTPPNPSQSPPKQQTCVTPTSVGNAVVHPKNHLLHSNSMPHPNPHTTPQHNPPPQPRPPPHHTHTTPVSMQSCTSRAPAAPCPSQPPLHA
jgi:hypothetical protein